MVDAVDGQQPLRLGRQRRGHAHDAEAEGRALHHVPHTRQISTGACARSKAWDGAGKPDIVVNTVADLTFLGAARTVTGSKYLLEHGGKRVLVDCGLFQGLKELRLRNWADFPVPPREIDAVVLTHAHLDHVGYLPRLRADGYKGRVFCTAGTMDLCRLVLPDSGRIQEEDARQANQHGYSKHRPGAAALHRERRARRADAASADRLPPRDRDRARDLDRVRAGRTFAGLGVRRGATAIRSDDSVRRRPRPLCASGAARSVKRRAGRRRAGGVHLWRPRSRRGRQRRAAGAGDSRAPSSAAAS